MAEKQPPQRKQLEQVTFNTSINILSFQFSKLKDSHLLRCYQHVVQQIVKFIYSMGSYIYYPYQNITYTCWWIVAETTVSLPKYVFCRIRFIEVKQPIENITKHHNYMYVMIYVDKTRWLKTHRNDN